MDRNTTQLDDITQTAVNRAYTLQCSRCQAVIEYDTHADWPTVNLLVNKHLATCPAKLNLHGPASSHPPSQSYDTQNTLSHSSIESMGANDSKRYNQFSAGRRKQKKREARRKRKLEDDEYTYSVRPTSVRCHGCKKEIRLDKRSRYYPGLWTKHRRKCRGIQKIEKDKLDKPVTRRDSIYNPRADSMLRVANSVENNISRQTELSDNGDLEEVDQDIPFSTLNERYYNECQQMGDGPWAYRYSTMKEIKERTINTVYFDIAAPNATLSIPTTTSLGCSAKTR